VKLDELITATKKSLEPRMVYTEPYDKDGITVIAAASISTGGGGGDNREEHGRSGEGGGFGLSAKPVGAYVIKNGDLRWQPAVDVNRLMATVGAIALAALFVGARMAKTRSARSPRSPR